MKNQINKLYFGMNRNQQDLLHQVKYLKVIYKQVEHNQMHDGYKYDDKIYEILTIENNNQRIFLQEIRYLLVCLNKNKEE